MLSAANNYLLVIILYLSYLEILAGLRGMYKRTYYLFLSITTLLYSSKNNNNVFAEKLNDRMCGDGNLVTAVQKHLQQQRCCTTLQKKINKLDSPTRNSHNIAAVSIILLGFILHQYVNNITLLLYLSTLILRQFVFFYDLFKQYR